MIAIVKYNGGNVRSIMNVLDRLEEEYCYTDDPKQIQEADKVIFPGVGEASSAMRYLREKGLDKVLRAVEQPFLGICLGMQLMCAHSEEGDADCLGIFDEKVRRFPPEDRVPHMGWNDFNFTKGALFEGVGFGEHMYFVHSYYAESGEHTIAETDYIRPFSAALQKDNFYGVQFHPEKSAEAGQQLIQNFIQL